ncbi:MAG TPA: hypothetical protein VGM39_04190 [Kofleriaceae bacterium]
MTTALATRRDYLDGQRRMIIARSVVGSLASVLPIPFIDDWAKEAVVGAGYKRIASVHGVDLDKQAVSALVHGTTSPPSLAEIAASGIVYRIAGMAAKRALFAMATANRARAASRTFVSMTLFDHYCTKLHVGIGLDGKTALALRQEIEGAIAQTPGALGFAPFRRGAVGALKATLRAPLELADLATRGALRRLLTRKDDVTEAEAVDALEETIDTALGAKSNFFSRTVTAVEIQLSAEANPYLDLALDALDRRWRARTAADKMPLTLSEPEKRK